jgi:hypothetical protein
VSDMLKPWSQEQFKTRLCSEVARAWDIGGLDICQWKCLGKFYTNEQASKRERKLYSVYLMLEIILSDSDLDG